jgi:uncharacterized membrane protein YcaP (DUF421 family)
VLYLALFALLRIVRKREAGEVGIPDLLEVVLIVDATQNGVAGNDMLLPDGLVLVATIVAWSDALDWLGYQAPWFEWLVRPRPLLVQDDRLPRQNMRRELITTDKLMSRLRLQGCNDLATVKETHMEGDGHISVVRRDAQGGQAETGRRAE